MQKYQWVLNIPPGQKSITSYKSIKTLHLAPLIPLNRFALSQPEELILSHLSLWYGTINTSKYFSFVRHYPPRVMPSPTPALVQCSNLWRNTPALGANFHPSHGFLQHRTWELHLPMKFMVLFLNYCFLNSSLITSFETLSKAGIPACWTSLFPSTQTLHFRGLRCWNQMAASAKSITHPCN